ncbi:MAG: 1-deoxy-D-xylulose-5-phosphate reductoisomerase, partial [Planctomycetota bacterium]|nr:1-deoxy-D-xylulose-5-phosphate reductoisomerase [Planctomycetota bacterium]
MKNIAVLGSTGSIGRNTLEVIAAAEGTLSAVALSAHSKLDLLLDQAAQFRPRWVVVTDAEAAERFDWSGLPSQCQLVVGDDGPSQVAADAEVDVVVAAIVGAAGLHSTWAAVEAGKTVALANKETLVMAGPLVMDLARRTGATILPVDSEHSAVFQALQAGRHSEVRRVVLTASGGPFRNYTLDQL